MSADHAHNYDDVGAASDVHQHPPGDILGLLSADDLNRLLGRIDAMVNAVQEMSAQLAAERALVEAVTAGSTSPEKIVAALRTIAQPRLARRAQGESRDAYEMRVHIAHALTDLAIEIGREAKTP